MTKRIRIPPPPAIEYQAGFHNIPVYRSLRIHRLQLEHIVAHFYGRQSILDKFREEQIAVDNLVKWKHATTPSPEIHI